MINLKEKVYDYINNGGKVGDAKKTVKNEDFKKHVGSLKAKELQPKLEMLKLMFRAKCLKRSANFDEEISKLHSLDKKLLALLEEMKELNIKFFE